MHVLSTQPDFVSGLDRLRETSDEVTEAFVAFRETIKNFGPIDRKQQELCLLAGFTALRNEGAFRVHCTRAAERGATLAEVQHVVLLMFGSNIGIYPAVETLTWAKEEFDGMAAKAAAKAGKK